MRRFLLSLVPVATVWRTFAAGQPHRLGVEWYLVGALLLAACATPAPIATTTAVSFPLTLTPPGGGESVILPALPQRIASLSSGHTEILFAIGAGEQVAVVDAFSDYPEEATTRLQVDAFQPSVEAIVGARPDLVLLTFDPGGMKEALERMDVPVLFLDLPSSISGVYDHILFLGGVTGHGQEAEELVSAMQWRLEAVQGRLADVVEGPRVFHEVDALLYTVGPRTFAGNFYTVLKAQNIAADAGGDYPQLTQEVIVAGDPEVVILADAAEYGYGAESPKTVAARPGWGSITAVQEGRVFAIDPDLVSRPGPRLVEGLEILARFLYPDRFP